MRNLMIKLPILLCIGIFLGCNKFESKTNTNELSFRIEVSKSELSHGELLLSSYPLLNKVIGKDSLLVFDGVSSQLILFNLVTKTPIFNLELEKDGPNFFEGHVLDADIKDDKLYVVTNNYFTIADLTGNVSVRRKLKSLTSNDNFRVLGFNRLSDQSFLFSRWLESSIFAHRKDSVDQSIFFVYNLRENSFYDIPIFSPEEALINDSTQGFYDGLSRHSFVYLDSTIVYNFKFSSKLYSYDLRNQLAQVSNGEFDHIPNLREAFPSNQISDVKATTNYLYNGVQFSDIAYDEKNELFVRVGSEYVTNEDGTNNDVRYLMLLDKHLNRVKEFKIKDRIFDKPFINDGIIYFVSGNQTKESTYELITFEIKNESIIEKP
ncbi:hypothetical protein [Roseivirga thermotolerans]|nr:hypothetical protein [Roseivirga thermotolerans]